MIPIRSKPPSLFQPSYSSSIRKHRIHSSLCDEASSLTRMRLCTCSRVALSSAIILRTSRSANGIFFQDQIKKRRLKLLFTCGPRCLGLPSELPPKSPGFLAIPDLAALLRSVSPHALALLCRALNRCLGRWYFTYQRSSPDAVDRIDDIPPLFQVVVGFPFGLPPIPGKPLLAVTLVALLLRSFGRYLLTHSHYP